MTEKERENLKRPITSKVIDLVILKLHTKKNQGVQDFYGEFY